MSRNSIYFLAIFTLFGVLGSQVSTASAQGRAARTQPNRSGLFVEGGGWFAGDGDNRPWFRAEVGLHLARLTRADLYLQIPVMLTNYRYRGFDGYDTGWFGLAVVPGVRGEWTMLNRKGDLALYLEGGGGLLLNSWSGDCGGGSYCDDPYVRAMVRTGFGVTYTAPFGLMVSVQPIGFGVTFGGDSYYYDRGRGFYDGSLMLGYRWP